VLEANVALRQMSKEYFCSFDQKPTLFNAVDTVGVKYSDQVSNLRDRRVPIVVA
jgi:hypothetical protein